VELVVKVVLDMVVVEVGAALDMRRVVVVAAVVAFGQ